MREIMKLAETRKAALDDHPFFAWVRESGTPLPERFDFAPIMANFVMNFRDMNLWFIRFASPGDPFRRIINGNTREDETHSRLFLEDWRKLGLDGKLGWSAGDTLWWLFLAPETEPFRGYAFDFARMTIDDGDDPMLRFAHSEAGEACGNSFFTVVAPVATALREHDGTDCRYFGEYHLDRERGHVIASEGVFEVEELEPERRARGMRLASDTFDIFFGMHDNFLRYAREYVDRRRRPRRPVSIVPFMRPAPASPAVTERLSQRHAEVQRVLEERKRKTAVHPFYAWLRDGSETPLGKLRSFVPMWVMDIMGYRDLNRHALRFRDPASEAERASNRWVEALESHSTLFMNDWDALDLDAHLGWSASNTLDFLFLDTDTDVHRRNIASFIKLALRHPEPTLRFWLLEALEASGEAFFRNTRELALAVERQTNLRLDYLADRHYLAHPHDVGGKGSDFYPFKSGIATPEERDIAVGMVETVFDAVDEQLTLSLGVARSKKLDARASLPRPPERRIVGREPSSRAYL